MRFSKLWMAVFISVGASCACAQVSVGAGAEFTTGKYGGTESTQELYLPFTGKLQTGLWSFKLTVPYLVVSGPANVIGGGDDRIPIDSSGVSDAGSATRTTSGLGDIVARASYSLLQETSSAVGLDVGARVKFGTADEAEGLGTGETDLSLQADLYKPLGAAGYVVAVFEKALRLGGTPVTMRLDGGPPDARPVILLSLSNSRCCNSRSSARPSLNPASSPDCTARLMCPTAIEARFGGVNCAA